MHLLQKDDENILCLTVLVKIQEILYIKVEHVFMFLFLSFTQFGCSEHLQTSSLTSLFSLHFTLHSLAKVSVDEVFIPLSLFHRTSV